MNLKNSEIMIEKKNDENCADSNAFLHFIYRNAA